MNEKALLMFVLALAAQVYLSGLRPIWAGWVLPAVYGVVVGATVLGYYQAYHQWPLQPQSVLVQGGLPVAALLLVWLGVQYWKQRESGWTRFRTGSLDGLE